MNSRNNGPEPRAAASSFSPYVPGLSIDEIKEQYGLSRVIKLASNENPLGVPPRALEVLKGSLGLSFRYPQSGVPRLTRAIAGHHGVAATRVAAGNGSDEIIDLLIRVLAEPGRHNVIAFKPCFSIYRLQARLAGVEFRQTPLNPDFSFPWAKFLALADENTKIAFVTSPDNPSGYCPSAQELARVACSLPASCLLVVDEAYMDFCDEEGAHSLLPRLEEFPNLAILRTFSKSFGLAGLRVGYGILPEHLADVLTRVHLPFSVNVLAEQAALAALEDRHFYEETLRIVRQGRKLLADKMQGLGFEVMPSQANFIMVRPPAGIAAAELFERLLQKGFIVRPLKSYGLDEYLRISIGTPEENDLFIEACEEIIG
ncbi:MAG: histidinol-phosphate transaminase [Desulfovibrionaceae bacterium]|nr:histidinol-phosphate transaminase [Desulfovibrionaceae bacterium]